MKINDKLLKKYATVSPMLPPSSDEEVVEVEVPRSKNEITDKWLALLQEAEGMDPLTEKPAQSPEELLEVVKEAPLGQESPSEDIGGDMPTIRPGKKANLSTDTLLKMCSQYHDLCHKL
jgi:hypothetical protein